VWQGAPLSKPGLRPRIPSICLTLEVNRASGRLLDSRPGKWFGMSDSVGMTVYGKRDLRMWLAAVQHGASGRCEGGNEYPVNRWSLKLEVNPTASPYAKLHNSQSPTVSQQGIERNARYAKTQ